MLIISEHAQQHMHQSWEGRELHSESTSLLSVSSNTNRLQEQKDSSYSIARVTYCDYQFIGVKTRLLLSFFKPPFLKLTTTAWQWHARKFRNNPVRAVPLPSPPNWHALSLSPSLTNCSWRRPTLLTPDPCSLA